jgi:V8-like Glu-specific endopeptidase
MFHLLRNVNNSPNAKTFNKRTLAFMMRIFMALMLICAPVAQTLAQQLGKSTRLEQSPVGVSDNRVQVADTSKFPFSAIVKLRVTFKYGSIEGSGALIGPNKVLTADHVVYNAKLGGDAQEIEVLPGYSNGYTICHPTTAASFKHGTHQGCHDGAKCDIAIITTKDSIGCNTGWFGFREYDKSSLREVFIAGYPADLNNGERLYFVKTHATHLESNLFSNYFSNDFHNILEYRDWTYAGMSGGPIFTSDYYIIGVHTTGGEYANSGVAICNQLFSELVSWKDY